jgi:hypothetical protein
VRKRGEREIGRDREREGERKGETGRDRGREREREKQSVMLREERERAQNVMLESPFTLIPTVTVISDQSN